MSKLDSKDIVWITKNGRHIPLNKQTGKPVDGWSWDGPTAKKGALHKSKDTTKTTGTDANKKEHDLKEAKKQADVLNTGNNKNHFKNGYGKTEIEDWIFSEPEGETSLKDNLDAHHVLSPEREALHKEIIDKHFEGKVPAKGQKTFYMTGGGGAAGKSTFSKKEERAKYMNQDDNTVFVDSDEIKKMLPEWDADNPDSAKYLHEESSMLSKRIMKIARENGYNYMLDGTGDNSVKSVEKKIKEAHDAGYKVVASYVSCDVETALKRNAERWVKTGRLVPYARLIGAHKSVSEILPKVADQFDSVKLYDSNKFPLTLIAEGGNGKKLKVLSISKYEKFLRKAGFTDLPQFFDEAVKRRYAKARAKMIEASKAKEQDKHKHDTV